MKKILGLLLCVYLVVANSPRAAETTSASTPSPLLPPVLLPVANDPTVSFRLWFKVGAQNDPAGKEGLAALTAAMLTEAATRKNSYEQILDRLFPLASELPRLRLGRNDRDRRAHAQGQPRGVLSTCSSTPCSRRPSSRRTSTASRAAPSTCSKRRCVSPATRNSARPCSTTKSSPALPTATLRRARLKA